MHRATLLGIAGSYNAYSLSLFNLAAYVQTDPEVHAAWNLSIIQHPLINPDLVGDASARAVADLVDRVIDERPELLALSCYMWNVRVLRQLASEVQRRLPGVRIVWGGPELSRDFVVQGHFDLLPADYVCFGEGERTFLDLLRHLGSGEPALEGIPGLAARDDDGFFVAGPRRTPFAHLGEVPSPYLTGVVDDAVLGRRDVEANIETQRGCSLRCSFCIYHKDMSRIAYTAVERVRADVQHVQRRGVKRIRFVDANFSSNLGHAKEVMGVLIADRVEARLMFELIPGFIDEELATLFRAYIDLHPLNDLTLGIGVQTINPQVLKRMRRGIKLATFEKTFALLAKYGIFAKIDLIIGLPGEDLASIERTLEYFLETLRHSDRHLLCMHLMRGLPGTELLEQAVAHGLVFSSAHEAHALVESRALPRADLVKSLRRAAVVFRLTNHRGWTRQEFIGEHRSDDTSVRDAFFAARDSRGWSNVELVDAVIGALRDVLPATSHFNQADFPLAETWWWTRSRMEVSNRMLLEVLRNIERGGGEREPDR